MTTAPPLSRQQRRALERSQGKPRKGGGQAADVPDPLTEAIHLQQSGRLDDAARVLTQAIAGNDREGAYHRELGAVRQDQGRLDDAILCTRRALALNPNDIAARTNLGAMLQVQGKLDEAVTLYQAVLAVRPNALEVLCNLGLALLRQGKPDQAAARYQQAIALRPQNPEALANLGLAWKCQGKLDQAVQSYERALALSPQSWTLLSNLGTVLQDQGKLEQAAARYQEALALKPDFADALANLGTVRKDQGQLDQAVALYRQALALKPDCVQTLSNLGVALKDQGKLDQALTHYQKALTLRPDDPVIISNRLFALNYADHLDPAEIAHLHRQGGAAIEGKVNPVETTKAIARAGRSRLRIGYVSPDFCDHPVAFFIEPVLRAHDRQGFEVFCYSQVVVEDAVTARLRALSDHWSVTLGLSDQALAERIQADGIDVLVDLAGHTAQNQLPVFARRPAPVQVTWLGYPHSTGLTRIDARLVDAVTDPPGSADVLASETLVRLPGGFLCYQPPPDAPTPAAPPSLANGFVTFGSFNNPTKLSPSAMTAWCRLLARMPDARLLLKGKTFADPNNRARILARCAQDGIAAGRIILLDHVPEPAGHLATYHRIDIALDPFPYNGTTTTCEALWMGVPVVTLCGTRHAARVGASLLGHLGLTGLIAETEDHYLDLAQALAADPARLQTLRTTLRPRMAASRLCDADAFTRTLEERYRTLLLA